MADTKPIAQSDNADAAASTSSQPKSRAVSLNKLYALPAPLRTFPLPTLVPHNPLSLFHILYVWLAQTIRPQSSHLETLYQGWWSPETRSVHVTDSRSIRGLWEQGFYGKGSLSRSEPSWLSREKTRRGDKSRATSEELTSQRRAERQQTKWERARKEREAIDRTLLEEAEPTVQEETSGSSKWTEEGLIESEKSVAISHREGELWANNYRIYQSPVGPLELLSLPNSALDLEYYPSNCNGPPDGSFTELPEAVVIKQSYVAPVGPCEILRLPYSHQDPTVAELPPLDDHVQDSRADHYTNGHTSTKIAAPSLPELKKYEGSLVNGLGINGHSKTAEKYVGRGSDINDEAVNGSVSSDDTAHTSNFAPNSSAPANGIPGPTKMKRQKSVRFSPTVEKNTFIQTEPPSPERAITTTITIEVEEQPPAIRDQEHFQLTLEEAFFLTYALGAITILDPVTRYPFSTEQLFIAFRKVSHFPPLTSQSLTPDDPFMLNYIVYHHFRSLGWVVRGGTKFSVDFMLYNRGPVFSHAEFAVIILPSYSNVYWSSNVLLQQYVKSKEKRTWAWMHCINRVISQVKKTLILVYVDIPAPLEDGVERELGVDGVLGQYKVREFVLQRWNANRSRD